MAAAGTDISGERIADQAQGRDSRKDPVHILFRQVRKVASVPLSPSISCSVRSVK